MCLMLNILNIFNFILTFRVHFDLDRRVFHFDSSWNWYVVTISLNSSIIEAPGVDNFFRTGTINPSVVKCKFFNMIINNFLTSGSLAEIQ